jgi:hypothetical protein
MLQEHSTGGQYMTLQQIKIGCSQNMPVWLSKIVFTLHFCTVSLLRLVKGTKKLPENYNQYDLTAAPCF